MAADKPIRSIAVAGGGIVGLSAAIAFSRALPGVKVTLVDLPVDPAAMADRMSFSLPAIGRFHAALGLSEAELVRAGIATHRLGTRFADGPGSAEPWHHVFGEYGVAAGGAAFHHVWARAHKAGRALAYDRYSAGAALAEAGKFVHPSAQEGSQLATFRYALRLDPKLYRQRLLAALPCERIVGPVAEVELGGAGVAALRLTDGRRVEADLYVDAAGPSAPLLSSVGGRFEDWSPYLPLRDIAVESAPPAWSSCDVVTATPEGWEMVAPMPSGSMRIVAGKEGAAIRPGRRSEPWTGNVLAIGDASVALDPIAGAHLHLAQNAILRALELLPGRDFHALELAEYNRRTAQETARVRDFTALHHGGAEAPDSLAHTLDQYQRRGRLPFYEEESFDRQSWLALLIGRGLLPSHADAVADGVDSEAAAAGMERLAATIVALPGKLPGYRDYLARMAQVTR